MKLTKAEHEVMKDINAAACRAFKHKATLAVIGSLANRGLITFDLLTMTATLTESGHEVLQQK